MMDRIDILKKTEIFSEIDEQVLENISEVLSTIEVPSGKQIIRKGDPGRSMYIIAEGEVKIHDGNHILTRLIKGSVFGEYALIDEEKRSASVTAVAPTILLQLDQQDFYKLASRNIDFSKGILKVLIQRLRERNELEEKLAKSYKKIHKQKQEIEEQHNNIRDQKTQLEQQNFDLIDLNEEKNHLLSVVVHGLKNPLTSSMCVSELLNNEIDQLSSSHQEYTSLIFKSLRRMSNMINQLLDINVIESKKIKLKLEKIYIKTVIKEVLQNFKLIIQQKNLNIHLELNNPLAKLNRVYLFQIIDNLISNAVKFAPRDTNIYIKLYEKGKHVLIEIRDEGAGIKESELKDIFNRYKRQTEKLNDPEEQAGLRLAIVKKYVDAMQGKVWCESEEGKGACFFVRFNKFIDAPDTL